MGLPASLKAVGPEAAHDAIVKYATTAFERAKVAGIKVLVFGSAASRRIPEGFPREQAVTQIIALCRRLAEPAASNGVTVAIEPLNKRECNFLVRLDEIVEVVAKVGHPSLGITADLYHMAIEGDGAAECAQAAKWIRHVHIAEKASRTPPGVKGDDFTPWFRVLKQRQYAGCISFECRWTNMAAELPVAIETVRNQWRGGLRRRRLRQSAVHGNACAGVMPLSRMGGPRTVSQRPAAALPLRGAHPRRLTLDCAISCCGWSSEDTARGPPMTETFLKSGSVAFRYCLSKPRGEDILSASSTKPKP
jgi:sugar phosphate isomerase/epimerase